MPVQNQNVVTQYAGVIKALVPFAARGKLVEGLNKFTDRIDKETLEEIKYEVNRLISPCERDASNKLFARGSTSEIKLGEQTVQLDEVGKRILKDELKRYNDTYTEGVFEAISSEQRYKEQVQKENKERIVEAYTVDCILGQESFDYDRAKVVPPFTVSSEKFENGEPQTFHFLSADEFAIHTNKRPKLYGGEKFNFTFPAVISPDNEEKTIEYMCKGVTSLPGRNNFSVLFALEGDENWAKNVLGYIKRNVHKIPLAAEQEERRTRRNLIKDAIVSNMPYVATLCSADKHGLVPEFELAPQGRQTSEKDHMSLCKKVLKRMSKEFKHSREIYQFQITQNVNGLPKRFVASLRELVRSNLLATFIQKGNENNSLRVTRLNLVTVDDDHVYSSLAHIDKNLLKGNEEYRYLIYSKDVTHELANFILSQAPTSSIIPEIFVETNDQYPVQLCIPSFNDRRREERFEFSTEAVVHTGWIKRTDATVMDISREGLRLRLSEPLTQVKDHLRVNIPSLGLNRVKYVTIDYNPSSLELRLAMTFQSMAKVADDLERIFGQNATFFQQRSSQQRLNRVFNYFWQICSLSIPGTHILIGQGKEAYQQLIVAQADGQLQNLTPFQFDQERLTTHGWFASSEDSGLTSETLTMFNRESDINNRCSFYINNSQKTYRNMGNDVFEQQDMRERLFSAIKNKKGKLIVHSIASHQYDALDNNWYNKRCQFLKDVNKVAIGRIRKTELECNRILTIFPVSNLHQNMLLVGTFGQSNGTHKPSSAQA